jgi:hypothetical protein
LSAPCDNCAFRPGSPEQADTAKWKELIAKLRAGGTFHCHKGVPIAPESEDGFANTNPKSCGSAAATSTRSANGGALPSPINPRPRRQHSHENLKRSFPMTVESYPLRWPPGWPRLAWGQRGKSRFNGRRSTRSRNCSASCASSALATSSSPRMCRSGRTAFPIRTPQSAATTIQAWPFTSRSRASR